MSLTEPKEARRDMRIRQERVQEGNISPYELWMFFVHYGTSQNVCQEVDHCCKISFLFKAHKFKKVHNHICKTSKQKAPVGVSLSLPLSHRIFPIMYIYGKDRGQMGRGNERSSSLIDIDSIQAYSPFTDFYLPFCYFLFDQVLRNTSKNLGANIQVLFLLFFILVKSLWWTFKKMRKHNFFLPFAELIDRFIYHCWHSS